MIKKVEGIVIREIPFKNTSKIITLLTKEYKTVSVIAKGAKQIKSKLRTNTIPFTYGFFHMYYKEEGLSTLISVDVEDYFLTLKQDIKVYGYACYVTDIAHQVLKQDYDQQIYQLYINTLIKLNEKFNPSIITNIFMMQILNNLGIAPVIDNCVKCFSEDIITFSVDSGGSLCDKCLGEERIISEKSLKLMRMFLHVDIAKISKLDIKDYLAKEINLYLDLYFDKYSGLYLKSKKNLEMLTTV